MPDFGPNCQKPLSGTQGSIRALTPAPDSNGQTLSNPLATSGKRKSRPKGKENAPKKQKKTEKKPWDQGRQNWRNDLTSYSVTLAKSTEQGVPIVVAAQDPRGVWSVESRGQGGSGVGHRTTGHGLLTPSTSLGVDDGSMAADCHTPAVPAPIPSSSQGEITTGATTSLPIEPTSSMEINSFCMPVDGPEPAPVPSEPCHTRRTSTSIFHARRHSYAK